MYRQVQRSSFLSLLVLVTLVSCQAAPTSLPTISITTLVTTQPVEIPTPTFTLQPTATSLPTMTPTPLCGTMGLPSATLVTTDSPRENAKFEPPDGQVYFGFTYRLWDELPLSLNAKWGDTRPLKERLCDAVKYESSNKTPTFITAGNGWLSPFNSALGDIHQFQSVLGSSVVPLVNWQADTNATTRDIASGKFDSYIKSYAQDVKQYGKPLFIRLICAGFNGNWDPGCSSAHDNSYSPLTSTDFVNAWHRVVDIFRQEGTTNVAWVWEPAAPVPASVGDWGWNDWRPYYPGDDYVDWIGAALWDTGKASWIDPVYQFGIDHQKPLLVEFAIRHIFSDLTHKQQISWLKTTFDYFESHPRIKAISYINLNNSYQDKNPDPTNYTFLYDGKVSYILNVNDMDNRLIAGGDDIRILFSNRIADPRYISILPMEP